MTNLRDVLAQVRSKITRYRGSRTLGEENTKATLIDPVLRALGWDVEDVEEVQHEFKRKKADKPVDYALFFLRSPRLFIEAKALGEDLDDRKWANQIMGYASVAGVKWVVLTDGDEYRIYNAHAPVAVEEKLFRTVHIRDEASTAEETLDLLSKERLKENAIDILWKAHFVDRQVRGAIERLFSTEDPDPSLVRLIRKRVDNLARSEIKASLSRVRLHLDFPVEPESERLLPRRSAATKEAWETRREKAPSSHKAPFRPGSLKALALDALRERPQGMTRSQIEEAVLKKHPELAKQFKPTSLSSQVYWMLRDAPERGVRLEIVKIAGDDKLYRISSEVPYKGSVARGSVPPEPAAEGRQGREGFRPKGRGLSPDVTVKDLISAGLITPPLELERTYKGRRLTARVEADGKVACVGKAYNSLSLAAAAARHSIIGGPRLPPTNGWSFWRFRDKGGEPSTVDILRQQYLRKS